jgi:hypothetical protein
MSEHYTGARLSDELRFTVALVSKIAVLNPPDSLQIHSTGEASGAEDVIPWWYPAGDAWFHDICTHVSGYPLSPKLTNPPTIYS